MCSVCVSGSEKKKRCVLECVWVSECVIACVCVQDIKGMDGLMLHVHMVDLCVC